MAQIITVFMDVPVERLQYYIMHLCIEVCPRSSTFSSLCDKKELKIYCPLWISMGNFYIYKACLDASLYAILCQQVVILPVP